MSQLPITSSRCYRYGCTRIGPYLSFHLRFPISALTYQISNFRAYSAHRRQFSLCRTHCHTILSFCQTFDEVSADLHDSSSVYPSITLSLPCHLYSKALLDNFFHAPIVGFAIFLHNSVTGYMMSGLVRG